MKTKRIICFYLAAMTVLTTLFYSVSAVDSAAFVKRLTAPAKTNKYYYNADYNIFEKYGYGMPNCTAYAYGRAYEILKSRPNLCPYNAGEWWSYNKENKYYKYGSTPKLGAIACWDMYDNNNGHVAVVEEITDKTVTFSESAYNGTEFFTETVSLSDANMGYSKAYRFLGYIYIGDFSQDNNTESPTQPPTEPTQPESPQVSIETELWRITAEDGVNFRQGPGTSYTSIGLIPKNTYIKVVKTKEANGYVWGYTKFNSQKGWCVLGFAKVIGKMGDVNQNGRIDLNDILAIQKHIGQISLFNSSQKLLADVNGDGNISTKDIMNIQKYQAGIIIRL